jgi:hypothetical protein
MGYLSTGVLARCNMGAVMTEDEFKSLWEPACKNVFNAKHGGHDLNAYAMMDVFLGVDEHATYSVRSYKDDRPMDPELRRKVALLASPHWSTVLKANKIKFSDLQEVKRKVLKGKTKEQFPPWRRV